MLFPIEMEPYVSDNKIEFERIIELRDVLNIKFEKINLKETAKHDH